jgi:signal transduction histidine kinase
MYKSKKYLKDKEKKELSAGDREIEAKEFYRKILTLQEEERKRISRDLHDETGQIVVALGTLFNVIEKELKNKRIDKALDIIDKNRTLLQEIAAKMKFMSFNLRSPALDILGLSAVLREYFSQCTANGRIRIEFKENLKDVKLEENMEITLYRIVQEAITNIVKHAQAKAVKVELLCSGEAVSLFVEDDGKGFNYKEYKKKHNISKMGLRGIKERVGILNGSFTIDSLPGKGTKLIVTLGLEK